MDEDYTYDDALSDMERVIAQYVSGLVGAIPEQDDEDLAAEFLKKIDEEYEE